MTDTKQRHGCLTVWLVLMIIANALVAVVYLLGSATMREQFPNAPGWAFPVLAVLGALNVVCAIALFGWKKWGFFGFCATSIVTVVINLAVGLSVAQSLGGLIGLVILYGVLQIGGDRKAWPQLD